MTNKTYDFSAMDFSRVCVIGSAGSGKTTFSKALGQMLDRDITHLDKILWGENWMELTHQQHVDILAPVVENPTWIIDGLWCKTLEMRYKRATLVIFLNYKPTLCAWRAFCRSVKNTGKQRDDLALGCVEKVNFPFYKYILNFRKNSLPKIVDIQQRYPNVQLVNLCSPTQTQQFIAQLKDYLVANN